MTTATAPTTQDGIELQEGDAVNIHEADGTTTYAIVQGVTPSGRAHVITGADVLAGKRRYVPASQLTSTVRRIVPDLREWVIVHRSEVERNRPRNPLQGIVVGPLAYAAAKEMLTSWYDHPEGNAYYMRRGTRAELAYLAE